MSCTPRIYRQGYLRAGFMFVPFVLAFALPATAAEQPQNPQIQQAIPALPKTAAPETSQTPTPGFQELNEQMQPDRDVNGISPGCPYNNQELDLPLLG